MYAGNSETSPGNPGGFYLAGGAPVVLPAVLCSIKKTIENSNSFDRIISGRGKEPLFG
jgi:hypothetical protein